ncbi:MAG: hypothetical protein HFH82_08050 [Lachnospiraceae bacterium]|nr:hypothetical protein [Lachnospiraceae bacterium]
MMKRKEVKVMGIVSALLIGMTNVIPVCAASSGEETKGIKEYSMEELGEWLDIDTMAEQYGVESNILLEKIYTDLHSDGVFSPFSNIELGISKEDETSARILPYLIENQDSTMYLETGNPCASGVYPYVGCVAVHQKSTTDRNPIFPFGTMIHYQGSSVNIGGVKYSEFMVEDTGDLSFKRTTYWTDVYGGANTDENYRMAINYGVKKVSFTWD